ncbi:type II secretion system F family protein [Roseomonas sp. HF4]|uniref:type II secretion system F family protein n=1 Tax=Roseomonas sp. HF4 TaxID=2562313 RepID=UPI0010C1182C|nr:type II secretion system F family protein [Roseomonas sp. HF4]
MSGLAALIFALLVGLALALWGLHSTGSKGRGRRLQARFAAHSLPHARVRLGSRLTQKAPQAAWLRIPEPLEARLSAIFGWDAERLDQYPAPPPPMVLAAAMPALLAGAYAASLLGAPGWLAALAVWIALARWIFAAIHRKRADALYRQLPDALGMVVRAVRAGIPVVEALRTVSREIPDPTGSEFRQLSDQLAIGIPMEDGLKRLARRSGLPEYRFFAVSLTLQNSAGGNLTETLDNLADVVRKRVATRQRGHALASQARASAYVLSAVPVVAAAALLLINPRYILLLFSDSRGNMVLLAAVASLGVGLGTMKAIIRRSLT